MYATSSPARKKLLFYWTALSIVVLGCALAFAQDQDQNQDPPPEAGRLSAINGNVSVQPAGAQDWGQAYANLPLGPGDRIYTDQGSRAEIQIGQTYLRVGPNTDVTLVDATNEAITIGLGAGSLDVHAFGLWPNQQLQVQTPSGTATVYQPTDFRTDVYSDQQSAVFTPINGSLDAAGAEDVGATVQPGQSFELAGTDPVYPQWLEPAPPDDLDQWSRMRDVQVSRARSYQYMSRGMPGGYELDAAGQWQGGTEYGNIWFPNVDPGWAPYRNGHWINRDPWGWVWVEDEPWGYAPFHYGRWVNYRGRWGWIPGPQQEHPVWSPALVVFAGGGGGGGGLSVWIPLGPGEPYRPWYRCSPRYIDRVNITNIQPAPRVRVQTTYVNITNVNVTNITYVNRTVGATAVPREAFASGRPVRQAAVHVTPQQMQQFRVVERPEVQPTRANMISRPVTRPVPVQARPVMINAKGQAVAAQPHARPMAPPVRQTAPPQPIPGRKAMAPPPNAKMTPGAQKAVQQRPAPGVAAKPGQGNPQPQPQPQPQRGNQPGQKPGMPAQTGRPTTQQQPNQPGALPQRPAPGQPNDRPRQNPPTQPEHPGTTPQRPGPEQPNTRPGQQPTARPGTPQQPQPERPSPQATQPAPQQRPTPQERPAPAPRPGPPERRQTNPPQRPATQPPAQARPENRPAPPQQRPTPEQRPAPPPQRTPPPQRSAPEQRPAPHPDTNRPNTQKEQKKPDTGKPKPKPKPDQNPQ